jgi:hypothetical protein
MRLERGLAAVLLRLEAAEASLRILADDNLQLLAAGRQLPEASHISLEASHQVASVEVVR